jgi:bacterioferritin (cytochrome b1)
MDEFICRKNIARFQELLAETDDEAKRKVMRDLLAGEEEKLRFLESRRQRADC